MSAADLGRDSGELDRQILDPKVAERGLEPRPKPLAADEAAAGEREVQEAKHPAAGQGTGEGLEHIEPAGRVAAADQGADRRADNDVELQAQRVEFPAARRYGPSRARRPLRARARLSLGEGVRRPAQGQSQFCDKPP